MTGKTLLSSLVESRQRQANRYIKGLMLTLDEETLKAYDNDHKSLAAEKTSVRSL